jgi:hypothetical protein
MKIVLSTALTLGAIALTATQGLAQSTWRFYSDEAGGYSISLPGNPESMPGSQHRLPNGDTMSYSGMGSFQENAQGIKTGYAVIYGDMPVGFQKNSKAAQQVLNTVNCKDFAVLEANQLVNQQSFRLSGYPGREIKCQGDQGTVAKIRVFLVGNRIYLLMAATNHEPGAVKSMEGFMKSFKLF